MFIELEVIEAFYTVPNIYKILLFFVEFTMSVVLDIVNRSVVKTVKLPF